MGGMQRIAVVLSVLWIIGLVGAEYFSIANYDSRVSSEYGACRSNATSEKNPSQREAHEKYCDHMRDVSNVSFGDDLSRAANDPGSWFILLAPIAALWIVGGIVLSTLRWIGGGFRAKRKRLSVWPFKPKVYICTVQLGEADGFAAGWYWAEMSNRQRRMSAAQRKAWLRSGNANLHGPFTTMADCHNAQYDVVQDRYRRPVGGKFVPDK